MFGFCPVIPFKSLNKLSLTGFIVLGGWSGAGVWARECTALEELELDTCVVWSGRNNVLRVGWAYLWEGIKLHLGKLVRIDVRWNGVRDISRFRYAMGSWKVIERSSESAREKDQRAFSELLESMTTRRGYGR